MKRIIVLSAVFLLVCSTVFAVSSVQGNSVSDLADKKPQQTVSLPLKSVASFEFGFSENSGVRHHSENTLDATSLALSAADKTIADNASSPLYIWWNITTSETFNAKLEMDGALTYDSANLIDWTVTRDPEDTAQLTGATNIDLSSVTGSGKLSCSFLSHTNENNTLTNYSGEQKLYISTVGEGDNTLIGKKTGDDVIYKATLTLSISAS